MRSDSARSRTHFDYVDGLRAIAVLGVVIFHVVVSEAKSHDLGLPGIETVGARGVDLFFVLSGFCLALPYLRAARASGILEIDYGKFISRRIARIAPPYYVALVAFTLLALTPFGYPSTWAPIAALDGAGTREFMPDLAFLTTRLPVANGSFWTLGIEMRWYFVFPLLLALFVRSKTAFFCLGFGLYALYFLLPTHVLDFGTLPGFMLGILAAEIALSSRRIGWEAIVVAGVLLGLAILRAATTASEDHGDPLWQIAFFAIVVASGATVPAKILGWKPLAFLGTASYSIYLVNQPLVVWFGRHGVPWPLAGVVATFAGIAFWFVIEQQFTNRATREGIAGGLRRVLVRYRRPAIVVPFNVTR